MEQKTFKKIGWHKVIIALIIVIIILQLLNVFQITGFKGILTEKLKPAKIELIVLKDSRCSDCFSIDPIVEQIKKEKVEITQEKVADIGTQEGRELAQRYQVEKIPTVIVTGETEKVSLPLEKKENYLLFTKQELPYTDNQGKIIGRVSVKILESASCRECIDLSSVLASLKKIKVSFSEESRIDASSQAGKSLIQTYKIDKLPTLIFSNDIGAYSEVVQLWPNVGTIESDGSYVMRSINPPYLEVNSSKVKGVVAVTYLTDKSCVTCYDVNTHKRVLTTSLGITLGNEKTVDSGSEEGKSLIGKYNITKAPTIIVSEEANVYPGFLSVWPTVGTLEKDGSYVFRNTDIIGTYKDLAKGEVVTVTPRTAQRSQ